MRPSISPALLAQLIEQAPSRLLKKLEKEAAAAEAWSWTLPDPQHVEIQTDSSDKVILDLSFIKNGDKKVQEMEQIRCSCLLSPKCFHILAVAHALPVEVPGESEEVGATQGEAAQAVEEVVEPEVVAATARQREAARALWEATASILHHGAAHSSLRAHADLLRAIHACRVDGLWRAANAGARVASSLQSLRARDPSFRLEALMFDVWDAMSCAWHVWRGEALDDAWVGTARRSYQQSGAARLFGLCVDAASTRSGYSGTTTLVCDKQLRIFSINDMTPGESRQQGSYKNPIRMGDTAISPSELCRAGLFVHDMTASADGRLGAGQAVKAARADASSWHEAPLNKLWMRPLQEQVSSALELSSRPPHLRPAHAGLIFLRAVVLGTNQDALLLGPAGELEFMLPLRAIALSERARENLRILSLAQHLSLWWVARVIADEPRTIAPLSLMVAPEPPEPDMPSLHLPEGWRGLCNIHLDQLDRTMIHDPQPAPILAPLVPEVLDPLDPLARRLERLLYGGRATMQGGAARDVEAKAKRLLELMMPSAATTLRELSWAASSSTRTMSGERLYDRRSIDQLGLAWTRGATYLQQARAALQELNWL